MTQDQSSRDGGQPPGARPRPGESTKPNHPVLKRETDPGQPLTSSATGGLHEPLAKTFVVPHEGNDAVTRRAPYEMDHDGVFGGEQNDQKAEPAPSLVNLFDDEDLPTYHYDKRPEPFSEESLVLTPEALEVTEDRTAPRAKPQATQQQSSQASWLQEPPRAEPSFEPPKRPSRVPMIIAMVIGGVIIVAISAVIGAILVLGAMSEESPTDNATPLSVSSSRPTVEGRSDTPHKGPGDEDSEGQGASSDQASAIGVPVPIESSNLNDRDDASATDEGAEGAEETEGADAVEGVEGAGEQQERDESEEAEDTAEGQSTQDQESSPVPSDLASVLSPLTEDVRRCTRRESGYHPRALTIHLIQEDSGRRRLRAITPPTPPRVVGCITRLIEGVTFPPAPEGSTERVTYTFELR